MKLGAIFAGMMMVAAAAAVPTGRAIAADKLVLALGQRGNWDTAVSELAQRSGIFAKHGIAAEILWTQGAGESQQAVLSGSADLGLVGTLGAFSAFAKGAPLRIVSAQATGAADFWYARTNSGIKSMADAAGKTIAYSTNGASTQIMVLGFLKQAGVQAKPVATGGPAGTLTQVMSGQVDIGWSSPPFGLDQVNNKDIQIIAHGTDLKSVRNQTIRVLVTMDDKLKARSAVFSRFLAAYRETVDWMYASDDALKAYANFAAISLDRARQVRDDFFPKDLLQPDEVRGVEAQMADAITYKYLTSPLTAEQLKTLIQIPKGP